jgi:hypothetical protein
MGSAPVVSQQWIDVWELFEKDEQLYAVKGRTRTRRSTAFARFPDVRPRVLLAQGHNQQAHPEMMALALLECDR